MRKSIGRMVGGVGARGMEARRLTRSMTRESGQVSKTVLGKRRSRSEREAILEQSKFFREKQVVSETVETLETDVITEGPVDAKANATTNKKKVAKKITVKKAGKVTSIEAPPDWKATWDMMVELRQERNAPVDSMGAESLGIREGEHFEFHTLIALMLSSQTKDQVVAATMNALHERGLTMDNIDRMSEDELDKIIGKVGFHRRKASYIKESVKKIKTEHGGRVPNTLEGLVGLPGVGPKMAFLVLNIAFRNPHAGIGVDTHMHRICAQLGWTKNAKTPEDTRKQLESWLPKLYWEDVNLIMVGLGQMTQQPTYRAKLLEFVAGWKDSSKKAEAVSLMRKIGITVPDQ